MSNRGGDKKERRGRRIEERREREEGRKAREAITGRSKASWEQTWI